MIHLLIMLAVAVIVIGVIYYLLSVLPIPEPARRFVNIAIVIIAAIVVIGILLQVGDVRM